MGHLPLGQVAPSPVQCEHGGAPRAGAPLHWESWGIHTRETAKEIGGMQGMQQQGKLLVKTGPIHSFCLLYVNSDQNSNSSSPSAPGKCSQEYLSSKH